MTPVVAILRAAVVAMVLVVVLVVAAAVVLAAVLVAVVLAVVLAAVVLAAVVLMTVVLVTVVLKVLAPVQAPDLVALMVPAAEAVAVTHPVRKYFLFEKPSLSWAVTITNAVKGHNFALVRELL